MDRQYEFCESVGNNEMLNVIQPRRIILTRGIGVHPAKQVSFQLALKDAGIDHMNIVAVSSVIPPACVLGSFDELAVYTKAGQIGFVVLAKNQTNRNGHLVSAAIGIAKPADETMYGFLAEFCGTGLNEEKAGLEAHKLAVEMLASVVPISPSSGGPASDLTFDLNTN